MQQLVIEYVEDSSKLPSTAFLSCMNDFAFHLSRDGAKVHFVNAKAASFIGLSAVEIQSFEPWWSYILTDDSCQKIQSLFATLDTNGSTSAKPSSLLLEVRTLGGALLPMLVHAAFAAPDALLLLASSPLDEASAEEILRQTQARFRSIVDGLSINLVLKGIDGRRIYANRAYLDLRGITLADIIGKSDADLFPADIAARFREDDRQVIETGKVLHQFEENVSRDGERTWSEMIKGPLRDADGHISGVQILFWDATERKATELAFQRERHLLHTLLDNVPDSIYFKDRKSRFMRISRGMAEKFKLSDTSVAIGKTDADIFTGEHAGQAREDELRIMETGQPLIASVERETWPDRPDTWCSTTKLPLYDDDGKCVGTFGISREITELILAEQQLREARDQADRANKSKSDFLANMSHEIRTPMNGIIGMTELLSHTRLGDDQRSFVEMIEQSAQSLLRIINDILDFSKIEAGKLDLDARPFSLQRCVSHTAKSLAMRAAQKSVELVLKMESDVPVHLIGDPDRLRQILVNLVGNAIKFTREGEITIRVAVAHGPPTQSDYTLHFSVRDTGIGIPAHKQEAIFEAFSQADVSTTRQYGGTGLGLSISSQLVEMMQGKIWLESEIGVGSTFHFTATFALDTTPATDEADEFSNGSLKDFHILIVDDNSTSRETLGASLQQRGLRVKIASDMASAQTQYARLSAFPPDRCALVVDHTLSDCTGLELIKALHQSTPDFLPRAIVLSTLATVIPAEFIKQHHIVGVLQKPALQSEICFAIRQSFSTTRPTEVRALPEAAAAPERSLRFLLAEDGEVNRAVFRGLLEREGHQVVCAEDGQAAVEAWREFEFDAILMDVQMPKLDGLQATELIRREELPTGTHIPIIAITAAVMEGDQARCREVGMDDYLSKPVDLQQLRRVVEGLQIDKTTAKSSVASPANETISSPAKPSTRAARDRSKLHINFQAPLAKLDYTRQQQHQLISTLKRETIQRLDELTRAIDGNDVKLLIRAAHSLRSAAALFEANAVSSVAGKVEDFARSGNISSAQKHFAELRQSATDMLAEINGWLADPT